MADPSERFLWPREHGAWAQMAMPLATGLLLGPARTAAAWLFTLAASLVFLAHEPGLVLLGTRGPRARLCQGALARRLLALLGIPALLCGAAAFALAPGPARWSAAAPALLGAATLWLASQRLEMTTAGELVVGAAMASALLPVALSGSAPSVRSALSASVAWTFSFAIAAVAVEAVLARGKPGAADRGRKNALRAGALWAVCAALPAAGLHRAVPVSLLPTALFAVVISLRPVGPTELRRLGWALVGSTTFTLVVLLLGLPRGVG
jgi:hypothetical protein